jgi:O-antigen ligase
MSTLFWSLVLTVLLAPLPLGAIEPWSWALLGCATGVLLLAWSICIGWDRTAVVVPLQALWPAAVAFAVAIAWIVLQMSPWTPTSWHHPSWELAGRSLGREVGGSITVNPFETASALFRLLAYAGIFWLSVQLCRSRDRARMVVYAVALAAFVYSAYGLAVHLSGSTKILWFEKEYYRDSLTSTFFYKNAFATFAGLGLICAMALILVMFERAPRQAVGRRERLRLLFFHLLGKGWVLLGGVVLTAGALLLSNSRGGLLAAAMAVFALFAMTLRIGRNRGGYVNWLAGAVAVAGVAFVVFSGGRVLDRLDDTAAKGDIRARLYELTLAALEDNAWLGTGYGSFGDTFQTYRTPDIHQPVLRAHNTYLDNAVELGIPAAAALTLAATFLAVVCFLGARRRSRDTIYPRVALAASVLVGVHATMDFTIEVPAVAAAFCLLLGCGVAQSWSSRRWHGNAETSRSSTAARIPTTRVAIRSRPA